MDMDFAVSRPLVRPGLPHIRFLFVRSRLRSALPSDPASRRRPCASLALHLHQVVQGTCTPRLSNMLGTQRNRSAVGQTAIARPPTRQPQRRPLIASDFAGGWSRGVAPCSARFVAWLGAGRALSPCPSRPSSTSPEYAPCPAIQIPLKANAVPVAASSSDFVSARPRRPGVGLRSQTALRIQDSADRALARRRAPKLVDPCPSDTGTPSPQGLTRLSVPMIVGPLGRQRPGPW
jgi:hypothetical protein